MSFYADLHVHSRYSRATSRDSDLEHMACWAAKKGVSVLGTGDFTHPGWFAEIRGKLVPAEPGLFRLRDDLAREAERRLSPSCRQPVRFVLEVEISTIYKKGERTRKVHHLVYVPDLGAAEEFSRRLARIGNIASDGRPILGLDSRDLLEIVLESGDGNYLVPAHVWTPWFSALGSKSGFDSVDECYGDLALHVFALETGLSADPPMIWRVSGLDRFRLVSNSDAHSPSRIGREACVFDTSLDFFAMRRGLETGEGYGGTVEFFPEEGKYHLDGHRKCGVRYEPEETERRGGICPVCGGGLTVGVMSRVGELADHPAGRVPENASPYRSLVPLAEVLSEIVGAAPGTRKVERGLEDVISRLGPELHVLERLPLSEVRRAGSPVLAEALGRMRAGRVLRDAGYDGEYGRIRLFEDGEVVRGRTLLLFDVVPGERGPLPSEAPVAVPAPEPPRPVPSLPDALDPDQRDAVGHSRGPLLVVAGPGTGKTRVLVSRIARLVEEEGVPPEACLAITFTRRAAEELAGRLVEILPGRGERVRAATFHSFGLSLLEERATRLGLPRPRVASETERVRLLEESGRSGRDLRRLLERFGRPGGREAQAEAYQTYRRALDERGWLDFDDLVERSAWALEEDRAFLEEIRARHPWISVDECQDLDGREWRLLVLLAPPGANLCAIGDPDQAIYGFRGSDVRSFQRFLETWPGARVVTLSTSHRSTGSIVEASAQAVLPATLVPGRVLRASAGPGDRVVLHEAATDRGEAEFVVHSVERLVGGTSLHSFDSGRVASGEGRELSFSDFAVLFRTKSLAPGVEEALARSGIPFQNRSHAPLAEDPVVEEFLAAVETGSRLDSFPPALLALAAGNRDGLDGLRNRIALGVDTDLWDPRADRVSLLTIHAAKGLEFRVVFVIGCEDGVLPLSWGPADPADPAEERRLLYVAMTRARDRLHLTSARERAWRGAVRPMRPTPFLEAIDSALLDVYRAPARKRAPRKGRQVELF